MKYFFRSIIIILLIMISFISKSLLELMISYLLLVVFIGMLYKDIFVKSKTKANIMLSVMILIYLFIGFYSKELYKSVLIIPFQIVVISQVVVYTIYPYNLNFRYKSLSLEKSNRSELKTIKRINLVIHFIVFIIITALLIIRFFI